MVKGEVTSSHGKSRCHGSNAATFGCISTLRKPHSFSQARMAHTCVRNVVFLVHLCVPELAYPATVAQSAAMAASVMPIAPFYHEFIADSGAGRSLESTSSLVNQGMPMTAFSQNLLSDDKIVFSTGNGEVTSSQMFWILVRVSEAWVKWLRSRVFRLYGFSDNCQRSCNQEPKSAFR